ncbi:MAG: hypothetical protein M1826_004563 [Phylliscum demangeonii]|nr:MAG: hypothetical protein M1826_004563 [Phylliscum demangeonii]
MACTNQDDINSSDQEFAAPAKPFLTAGQKSIEAMFAGRERDRMSSKKLVRELADTASAPSTMFHRSLWIGRFLRFWEGMKPGASTAEKPPAFELVERFVATIVQYFVGRGIDKPAPSSSTLRQGMRLVLLGLEWRHRAFCHTTRGRRRLDTIVDTLSKRGDLTRATGARVGGSGCSYSRSWHSPASKTPSSMAVARGTSGYAGEEFLAWQDVQLCWDRDGDVADADRPKESDLHRLVWPASPFASSGDRRKLRSARAPRDRPNEDRVAIIEPLTSPDLNVICPVKLLLVQALRHGAIPGATSLRDVWQATRRKQDRLVPWARPADPVLPAIATRRHAFLDLPKPAGAHQIWGTVRFMARTAEVVTALVPHDIRRGAARDLAHLRKTIPGVSTAGVTRALGHPHLGQRHRRIPAAPRPATNISPAAIDAYCADRGWDPSKRGLRKRASRAVAQRQLRAAMDEPPPPPPNPPQTAPGSDPAAGAGAALTAIADECRSFTDRPLRPRDPNPSLEHRSFTKRSLLSPSRTIKDPSESTGTIL